MKIRVRNILSIIVLFVIILAMSPKVQAAAGLVINFSKSTANVGDTVTITVTGNDVKGTANLTVSGNATLSKNTVSLDNGSASVDAKITGEGSIRITATAANMTNSNTSEAYTGATGGTITAVKGETENTDDSNKNDNEETEKSSDATLSNLGIKPNDFTGFNPETMTYNVTVPENVDSIEVYATAKDTKATVSGTGTQALNKGKNALNVVVTAEDGTIKTYVINVTRGEEDSSSEEESGLSNIKINGLELNPPFQTSVYEYTVKYVGEETSLDIQTVATDPSYNVEILGNENLKEGENTITILVADSEGNNVATYQLTVNKSLVSEDDINNENEQKQKEEQKKMLIIAGGVIGIIFIIIIAIIIKRKRNKAYAEEFSGVPFAGINNDDDELFNNDNNQEEMPTFEEKVDKEDNISDDEVKEEIKQDNEEKLQNDKEDEELDEKAKAKKAFLEAYNLDNDEEEYEEKKQRRGRKKGKRFK